MDKSFMIFITIGIGFFYFVTTFVGNIQEEDEAYRNSNYNTEGQYDKYKTVDSIGQDILNLTEADAKTQLAVWNSSLLKDEFLELFPNFDEMKDFVNDRTRGKMFQDKLIAKINQIEDKFFSGTVNTEQAKQELSELK